MPSRKAIDQFLQQKRIAMVGVSRDSKEFANTLYRQLKEKGYDMVPVNPAAAEVEGVPCYPTVAAIAGKVDGVLVMVPANKAMSVVQDSRAAGVEHIWFYRAAGPGAVSPEAVAAAQNAGMNVVDGACPFMFVGSWPHKIHRLFTRFTP